MAQQVTVPNETYNILKKFAKKWDIPMAKIITAQIMDLDETFKDVVIEELPDTIEKRENNHKVVIDTSQTYTPERIANRKRRAKVLGLKTDDKGRVIQ